MLMKSTLWNLTGFLEKPVGIFKCSQTCVLRGFFSLCFLCSKGLVQGSWACCLSEQEHSLWLKLWKHRLGQGICSESPAASIPHHFSDVAGAVRGPVGAWVA